MAERLAFIPPREPKLVDRELKFKFAKILDLLAVDQDDMETVAVETAAHMTDFETVKVADLICDFTTSSHKLGAMGGWFQVHPPPA
jgi:hypothetical protein